MAAFKSFINAVTAPQILFPIIVVGFLFVFPPTPFFDRLHRRLRLNLLWTAKGGVFIFSFLLTFFAFGLTDGNFRAIVTKPDNVPIVGLVFLAAFFLWLAMKQALENDARLEKGEPPQEAVDAKEKILVWPDLVFIELLALIAATVLLIIWSVFLKAPLEQPANPTVSPNPSKAPWYFLGLQEMLVYYDPWIAGVLFPTVILLGLMCVPFLDTNPKGTGYYCYKPRRFAINTFLFFWLVLWLFLIMTGTFLRGPNWNFFGPFERWDVHKVVALTNINLSELIYVMILKRGLPSHILLREAGGIVLLLAYFGLMPWVLSKTIFRQLYQRLGVFRYSVFIVFFLLAASLPLKMFLRWAFNIKYIVAIPEFFFNI